MSLFPTVQVDACPLCSSPELVDSHILPHFVFEWFRKTSATGYMRMGFAPNVRVQDGPKQALLCRACDQKIGVWEKLTAEKLFHPYHSDTGVKVNYGPWLSKLCASVCWRILYVYRGLGLKSFSDRQLQLAGTALEVWADFMFDRRPHPGNNELHLLPVDTIGSASSLDGLPANINRYLARSPDMDVICTPVSAAVYAKLGKLIVIGFIEMPKPRRWQGTRVAIKGGTVQPRHYILPGNFHKYLTDRAELIGKLNSRLSPTQRAKIEKAFRSNPERVAGSETTRALEEDIRMFGQAALDENLKK